MYSPEQFHAIMGRAREELILIEKFVKEDCSLITGLTDWDAGGGGEIFITGSEQNYRVLIDRNFLITLRDLAMGKRFKPGHYRKDADRSAAAHFLFFRLSDILMVPTFAVLEGATFSQLWQIKTEWDNVEKAGRMNLMSLLDFAEGRTDFIDSGAFDDHQWFDYEIPAFPSLRQAWEFNLLQAVKCTILRAQISNDAQWIEAFIDWQFNDFLIGVPAFLYLQKAASPNRISGMLKGSDPHSVTNAAWDLTLIQYWSYLVQASLSKRYMLCSFDKAFLRTVRLSHSTLIHNPDTFIATIIDEIHRDWGVNKPVGKKLAEKFLSNNRNKHAPGRLKLGTDAHGTAKVWGGIMQEYQQQFG